MADVFISYSRKNIKKMLRLKNDLQKRNIDIWTDEELTPGTPNWKKTVEKELQSSKCLIVLMSPEAYESEWVRRELGFAELHEVPIIPVLSPSDGLLHPIVSGAN